MTKKKKSYVNYIKLPAIILGCLIALGTIIVKSAEYIKIPEAMAETKKSVKENKEQIQDIKYYIDVQQTANDLMQKRIDESKKEVISPDGKWRWDDYQKKWVKR